MTDHEHNFEGAWFHFVTTIDEEEVWIRICTVGSCPEYQEQTITKQEREEDFLAAWEGK